MTARLDDATEGAPRQHPLPASVRRRYDHRYAVLCVETTGLVPEVDRVVRVTVTLLTGDGDVEGRWASAVDPGFASSSSGTPGARPKRAPSFEEVAGRLGGLLASRVLVAHNAQFDWAFLAAEFRRTSTLPGVDLRLCTRNLAKRLDLPVTDLRLPTLATHFGVPVVPVQNADECVRVLVEVLRHELQAADRLGIDLPLTPCSTAARGSSADVLHTAAASVAARVPRAPRVDCPWALPAPWVPGAALVQGHRFVITGPTTTPRALLYEEAVAAGLDAKNGMSRATSFVVAGARRIDSRKLRWAEDYGTPIIDEPEFHRLLSSVRPGTPKTVPRPRTTARAATPGPLTGRRVLVLGEGHAEAAATRAEIVSLGAAAAVNLTVSTTDVVALEGAQRDRRWVKVKSLGLPLLNPSTWRSSPGSATTPAVGEPVVLPRGGAVNLPPDVRRWVLDVQWEDDTEKVDVVALLLDSEDQVGGDEDLVFHGAPTAPGGSVSLTVDTPGEAEVRLSLDAVPADVERLLVAAAVSEDVTFREAGAVELTLRTADGAVFAQAVLDAATVERTLVLGEVYRRGGAWRFRARGQGHEVGLRDFVEGHGVEVDE